MTLYTNGDPLVPPNNVERCRAFHTLAAFIHFSNEVHCNLSLSSQEMKISRV